MMNLTLALAATADAAAIHGNTAEWVTAGVAGLALGISGLALTVARRSERRQQFIRIHELLTSPESQAGRRLLHKVETADELERLTKERNAKDFDLINRAVSLFNTLAVYARKRYLRLDEAKDLWGETIKNSWPYLERFLKWRRETHGTPTLWHDLVWLAQECGASVSPEVARRPEVAPRRPGPPF